MEVRIPKFRKLRIEINSDCNRKCVFCPRGTDVSRWQPDTANTKKKALIGKRMATEDVLSIMDQNIAFGFNAEVGFDFYNEVTLDERLLFFCEYANLQSSPVAIVTNGDSMRVDEKFTKELFRLVSFISISLYDYKDKDGRQKLMSEWDKYLVGLGIHKRQYELVGEWAGFGNRAGLIDRRDKFLGGADKDKLVPIHANCKKIHSKLNIRYDGEVPICCEDSHIRYSLGNVLKTSIEEVWYGEKMRKATELLMQGNRAAITPCSKCVKSVVRVRT